MTTLLNADGALLRVKAPAGSSIRSGLAGPFPPMWSDGERWGPGGGGVLVSYDSIYRTQPAVAAVVDKLARRIATLPFDSYRHLDNGGREIVRDDTLASLLRRPMPRCSTVDLVHSVMLSLLVHGNAVVAKVRGADREAPPIMLWPLDWSQLSAYGPIGGRIEWWSTSQFEGQERYIAVEDTLHFSWSSVTNEIGISPLEKLGVTVRLEDAAQRYQTASFRNGARPSGALVLPADADLDSEQRAELREEVKQQQSGDNAFNVALLSGGMDWKAFSHTAVEAELVMQRRLNREEVGMVYDMAGPLMNDLTHGTYSNVAEFLASLYRDVVPPWTTMLEATCQAQLLDPEPAWYDRFVAFDFTDKLKGEPREQADTLKTEVEAGLLTRNEARKDLNRPPLDDPAADQATANVNNQAPLSSMATGAQATMDTTATSQPA